MARFKALRQHAVGVCIPRPVARRADLTAEYHHFPSELAAYRLSDNIAAT